MALSYRLVQTPAPSRHGHGYLYTPLPTENPKITVQLALFQPDIAQNTGTLLRLGACLGVHVHIIHPTGFIFSPSTLRRAALDYLDPALYSQHDDFSAFDAWRRHVGRRLVLLTTRSSESAYAATFGRSDILLLGRESAGVPDSVADIVDARVRIPMRPHMRSLNVAVAASLVLGEALRQTGHFEALA